MNAVVLPRSAVSRAAVLMLASMLLFGSMAAFIKLASKQLHPFEIAFFRNLFGFIFALPLLLRHGPGLFKTAKLPLYLVRCAIGTVGMLAGFWAIVNLPLAQAVSLSYSTPLFVTIGAVLVLGETVRARRWTAVLIGFLGVLVIVRPGIGGLSGASLIALLAAAMSASVAISIKFLSRTEHPDAIVLFTSLLWIPMSLLPAVFYWEWPQGISWLWIVLAGLFGTVAHLFWTRALKLADASALTPISFTQVLVAAFYGWVLFDEPLDGWTALGAAIIFGSNLYIARREAKLASRTVTDPDIGGDSQSPR